MIMSLAFAFSIREILMCEEWPSDINITGLSLEIFFKKFFQKISEMFPSASINFWLLNKSFQ